MRRLLKALLTGGCIILPAVSYAQSTVILIDASQPAGTQQPAATSPFADGWHAPGVSMFLPGPATHAQTDLGGVTGFTPRNGSLQLDIAIGDTATAFNDGAETVDIGVSYGRSFDDVDLTMRSSLGMSRGDTSISGEVGSFGATDNTLGFGAVVGVGRFTLGASFDHDMALKGDGIGSAPLTAWDVGLGYEAGPWGLSLSYGRNQAGMGDTLTPEFGTGSGGERRDQVTLGFSYRLSDSVDVGAFGALVGSEDLSTGEGLGAGSDRDVQGFVIGSGVEIDF
ncbi:MAG: porin [Pseudomonadota bacterium]